MSILLTAIVAVVVALTLAAVAFQIIFEVFYQIVKFVLIFAFIGLVIVATLQTIWGLMMLAYTLTCMACSGVWKAAKWMLGIKPPARPRSAFVPAYRA